MKNKIIYRAQLLVKIQSSVRMWHTQKQYKPRIAGVGKVRAMYIQLNPMKDIAKELKKDKDSAMKKINSMEKDLQATIMKFKVKWL